MTVSSASNIILSFFLILVLNVVQGTLTPNGNVSVDCGGTRTFTCAIPREAIKWTTSGLSGISRGPFLARNEAMTNCRITSPDTGGDSQTRMSRITISAFSRSDNGGTIQCINARNGNVRGMATISVGLHAPANVVAKAKSCDTVTLQWDQPCGPNDITTSVSCTPPSPGCAECTTSPCTITDLNPSTEYEFTVTLNSVMCGTSMNTTGIGTGDLLAPTNVVATVRSYDSITLQWDQPSEPNDITASVSCTPPSPGCTECTTSPCTITGLNTSIEYQFTVTLNSGSCRTSMGTTTARTVELHAPANVDAIVRSCDNITLQWTQPSEPNDIITSVSCTPPSPGCAECKSSPCNITSLNPSTEYVFTVTLNSGGCRASMSATTARPMDSCVPDTPSANTPIDPPSTPQVDTSAPLAALVLLLLPIPLLYPLGVLIANLVFFKDKSYCEVFWCFFFWRKDKIYEMNSTELRQPREEAVYQNVPKKKDVFTNGDEIKEPKRSKQEVVTDETKQQEDKDEGVITDDIVQQQGSPDGHHKQKRSRQHKEEVQYQNLGVAKKKETVTNGDEVKKPNRSKQEVVSTGNVIQQQGNPDGIQYADLDFSEQGMGRNVIHTIVDPVTYAEM